MAGEHGHAVRADLVRRVSVGGDAVGSHDHGVHLSFSHEACGHVVADERAGNARARQLPRREARALPHRARLVGVHALDLALLGRGVYHAERRAVERRRQASGVAVREHAAALPQQRGSVRADGAVRGFVLGLHALRLREQGVGHGRRSRAPVERNTRAAQHALDRPAQVHRGRARAGDLLGRPLERGAVCGNLARARVAAGGLPSPKRHGSGARHADGGRAAHRERLDRVHHRPPIRGSLDRELAGQQALVDVGERRGAVGGARQLHGARETVESEVRGHGASFPSETTILTESARARREDVAPRRPTGRGMPSERSTVRSATGS